MLTAGQASLRVSPPATLGQGTEGTVGDSSLTLSLCAGCSLSSHFTGRCPQLSPCFPKCFPLRVHFSLPFNPNLPILLIIIIISRFYATDSKRNSITALPLGGPFTLSCHSSLRPKKKCSFCLRFSHSFVFSKLHGMCPESETTQMNKIR